MNTNIEKPLEALGLFTPVPWESIPDFGLYMDQVITFLSQMYKPLYGGECLSASMINNYVKAKLLPHPQGKKYTRVQIALLAIIAVLKQTTAIDDIRTMLQGADEIGVETLYTRFCARQTEALNAMSHLAAQESTLPHGMDFAVMSSAYQCALTAILRANREEQK